MGRAGQLKPNVSALFESYIAYQLSIVLAKWFATYISIFSRGLNVTIGAVQLASLWPIGFGYHDLAWQLYKLDSPSLCVSFFHSSSRYRYCCRVVGSWAISVAVEVTFLLMRSSSSRTAVEGFQIPLQSLFLLLYLRKQLSYVWWDMKTVSTYLAPV